MLDASQLAPFQSRLAARQVKTLLSTLRLVDLYFQESGQSYFLTGGSLIGYVRYGHVLPWDDDIDLHCHGPLAVEPRLIARLGLEVDLSPHSIRFRKSKCRMLVEVLPLTKEGVISFRGVDFAVGEVTTKRALYSGVETSVPVEPERILDSGYGASWRTVAVPPTWDHVRRLRIKRDRKAMVPVEALDPIVADFRARLL